MKETLFIRPSLCHMAQSWSLNLDLCHCPYVNFLIAYWVPKDTQNWTPAEFTHRPLSGSEILNSILISEALTVSSDTSSSPARSTWGRRERKLPGKCKIWEEPLSDGLSPFEFIPLVCVHIYPPIQKEADSDTVPIFLLISEGVIGVKYLSLGKHYKTQQMGVRLVCLYQFWLLPIAGEGLHFYGSINCNCSLGFHIQLLT